MAYPIPGPNLSDLPDDLMLEEYAGIVQTQFAANSIMREYADIRPVLGTDTIFNNRMGKTTLKKLIPGVRPPAEETPFGKVSLTVDTVILARDNRSMLNEFQTHFEVRSKLAKDHGIQLGKFFDQAFIIMAIKGSLAAAPVLGNPADPLSAQKQSIGAGKSITLAAAGDEDDPDILAQAITDIITQMEEEEIPTEEIIVMVRPTKYQTLLNNNKLLSKDFSGANGDFAKGKVDTINGARIVKSARIPEAPVVDHFLSNAANSNAYDLTGTQANAVAVIFHPDGLMAGETIPLQSNIFWSDIEKQWFIDSWMAFGVTIGRPDVCGAVFKTV